MQGRNVVLTLNVVVGCVFHSSNHLLRMKKLAILPSPGFICNISEQKVIVLSSMFFQTKFCCEISCAFSALA